MSGLKNKVQRECLSCAVRAEKWGGSQEGRERESESERERVRESERGSYESVFLFALANVQAWDAVRTLDLSEGYCSQPAPQNF